MASLTRNEWIEMWATMKAMEYDMIHFPIDRYTGPFVQRQQNKVVQDTLKNIRFIKDQIQSVIGQME